MTASVVIATYNGEKFITQLLQSILEQTRLPEQVIITDDNSTDNTCKIVSEFIKANEKNLGYAENYKRGVAQAKCDVIFFADQDDVWVKNRLEVMLGVMEQNNEVGLLNADYVEFSGEIVDSAKYPLRAKAITIKKFNLNAKNRFLKFPGCVMCLRKEFYDSVKEFWYEGWAHDEFLWCLAVLYNRCYHVNFVSLLRRVHENQTSGKIGRDKNKRIKYLESEIKCASQLIMVAEKMGKDKNVISLYKKNKTTSELRLKLVKERKIFNLFRLIFRLKYYNSKKSFLVEGLMAIKC